MVFMFSNKFHYFHKTKMKTFWKIANKSGEFKDS